MNTKKSNRKTTKKNKFKPYSLKCGEGYVAEVSKGIFIGIEKDGGFTLVDDMCDGYIGVGGEMNESIEEYWRSMGKKKGYPRLHKVMKELTISGCLVMNEDGEWEEKS